MALVVAGSLDPGVRGLIATMLGDAGYTVIQAADGGQVAAAVDQHEPELVVLDNSVFVLDDSMTEVTTSHLPEGLRRRIQSGDISVITISGGRPNGHRDATLPVVAARQLGRLALDTVVHRAQGTVVASADHGRPHPAQAELAAIVQSSHDAIMGKTLDGRITSWNPGAERLYGYTAAEMVGRPARLLFPPEQQGEEAEILQRISAGERVEQYQTRRVRKDGSQVTVSLTVSPIMDEHGGIVGAASVSRDIGGSVQVQTQLAAIVQSSHDAIMGKTLDGRITSWNPGAERLYGYTAAEMVGRPARLLFPPEQQGDEAEILQRISAGERVEQYQTRRVRKDGSQVTVSLTVSPIMDEHGGIVGAASVSRDMDPQQQAEARFRGLLDAAPDSIIGVDVSGAIVLVNAQAERLFGYLRRELLGQPVQVLIPQGVHTGDVRGGLGSVGDPGRPPLAAALHPYVHRKDGSVFPAEISISAFETSHGVVVAAAIRDVTERLQAQADRERLKAQTERERLERQLHQAQRLESLGQLAGGIAHDFNNMLGIILNYIAFVSEEVAAAVDGAHDRDWEAVRRDAERVKGAAERAAGLTHQLLAFARREVVRPQVLNLNTVMTDIEQMLTRTLGEHVHLVTDPGDRLWPVLADRGQMDQVLVNLAVNARDAMPAGGTLTIRTRNVTPEQIGEYDPPVPPDRYVFLQVADTGTGIPKDVLDRVFEPFFTTKASGQGTGLGLATVYGAITQAGGHLRIASEENVGTIVTALLPITDRTASQSSPAATQPPTAGAGTILVIEDERGILDVVQRLLTRNGYTVITAASGAEAIDKVRWHDQPIDLLLTDVVMPHMLGREVAEKIRSLRPNIQTLYMSGYAQPVLASQGTLDPHVRLIEKPFTEPELLAHIREILHSQEPVRKATV